jgi:hypothetical protein
MVWLRDSNNEWLQRQVRPQRDLPPGGLLERESWNQEAWWRTCPIPAYSGFLDDSKRMRSIDHPTSDAPQRHTNHHALLAFGQ